MATLLSDTPQRLDSTRRYTIGPLKGPDGARIVDAPWSVVLTGSEPRACRIWQGEGGPTLATPTATWASTAAGTLTLTIAPADLATLAPGRYRIELTATIAGDVLACLPADAVLDLADAPGTAPAPSATLTRAKLERVLLRRCGTLLSAVGLDGTTRSGANPDLDDPIAAGLLSLALAPLDPTEPADADLAGVTGATLPQLLDVAELRCLESVLGHWDQPDQQAGMDNQGLGRLRVSVEARAGRLEDRLRRLYGHGVAPVAGGVLDLDFAQSNPLDPAPLLDYPSESDW
jgi:hypothetical protein